MSQLTSRFDEAFRYAHSAHDHQRRKGTEIPYIAHLMAVAALVIEDGGDEDQAIAALLHDAVEDQGGLARLDEIRSRFGDRVAEIVLACSDSFQTPKPPWRERKQRYLEHLRGAPEPVQRVSLADKLHNARSILVDLRQRGPETFRRFRGGQDGTLWYYRQLVDIFKQERGWASRSPMVFELERVVAELERLAGAERPAAE